MYRFIITVLFSASICLLQARSPADSLPDTVLTSGYEQASDSRIVSTLSVQVHNCPGNPKKWESMARKLISLREGETYSSAEFASSMSALAVCNKFKTISVDSVVEADAVALTFTLEPYLIIKKIVVLRGYFPLFESEILKAMTIRSGSPYSQEILAKQKQLIEVFYKREGYPNAAAEIEVREFPDEGYVDLRIAVDKGRPFLLRDINLEGNKAFSDFRLKIRMKTWLKRLIPFSSWGLVEKNIANDVKRLTVFYRKGRSGRRYPECEIKYTIKADEAQREATLLISINEGRHYSVRYKKADRTELSRAMERGCKREVIIFEKGNRNDLGLRKSMQNIKRFYYEKGYVNAKISYTDATVTKRKRLKRKITFLIDEDTCTLVRKLVIKGNNVFELKKLEKQILTRIYKPFVLETFEKDMQAIESLYRSSGYRSAVVNRKLSYNKRKTRVSIYVDIHEGVQTIVSEVAFDTLVAITEEKARKAAKLKAGAPYQRALAKSDEIALSAAISKKGYPYVKIMHELENNSDSSGARLIYRIDPGPRVYMGRIYYTGNFKTKSWAVKREIGIKRGKPFYLKKMLMRQKDLRNLGIFNTVTFKAIGLKERRDTVHLFVEMEEKRPYYAQLGIGYEHDLLWGQVKAGDHNFMGLIRDLSAGAKVTQTGGYRFDLCFLQSRLFGYRVKNITEVYFERVQEKEQEFGVKAFGVSIGLSRKMFRYLTPALGLSYERRDQFGMPDAAAAGEFKPRNLIYTTPSLSYDKRDSKTRPKNGLFSTFTLTLSKGLTNSFDDFAKYQYELRYFITVIPRITLATVGRVGYLDPILDNKTIPQDQLFFLGGTRDVRGFNENELRTENGDPVGGRAAMSASIETRVDLGFNFELPLFFDIGRIQNSFDITLDQFRSSAGLGLRWITPIGPVGLLYGFKLNGKRNKKDIGRFHFSLGYTF